MLKATIDVLCENYPRSQLFVGSAGSGVLNDVAIDVVKYTYPRFRNKYLVLLLYLYSQLCLFFRLSLNSQARADDIVYVNTVLPFGAAIFGKLFGKKVVYHIHEVSLSPPMLFKILMWIADRLANVQLYVSYYHRDHVISSCKRRLVLSNGINPKLFTQSITMKQQRDDPNFVVLMPASLRSYKGVDVFIELCKRFAGEPISWVLLLNDEDAAVNSFREEYSHIVNLKVFNRVNDPSQFYLRASLVVNLSYIDQCVETFGLTLVEAFTFGLPVIAPPIGGPTEIVDDGVNGFLISSYQIDKLQSTIKLISDNPNLYKGLSKAAKEKSKIYTPQSYATNLRKIIESENGQ